MDTLHRLRRLFDYDVWANARVNQSLRSAAERLRQAGAAADSPAFVRALQIWAHIQWARRMWLFRLGVAEPPPMDEGMFPPRTLEQAAEECAEMDELWREYVHRLSPEQLRANCRYTSTEGVTYDTAVADILDHVVSHSCYHRGQIARLVAECGGKVEPTDFIVYARTRV